MFLVVNAANCSVMNPYSAGYLIATQVVLKYNHFDSEPDARKFAEWCAAKFTDCTYAVLGVLGKVKAATPPMVWS